MVTGFIKDLFGYGSQMAVLKTEHHFNGIKGDKNNSASEYAFVSYLLVIRGINVADNENINYRIVGVCSVHNSKGDKLSLTGP